MGRGGSGTGEVAHGLVARLELPALERDHRPEASTIEPNAIAVRSSPRCRLDQEEWVERIGSSSSGVSAGPENTSPVALKREPWQGQSQV